MTCLFYSLAFFLFLTYVYIVARKRQRAPYSAFANMPEPREPEKCGTCGNGSPAWIAHSRVFGDTCDLCEPRGVKLSRRASGRSRAS